MRLERLALRNFRNYSELQFEAPPGVVVLHGDNGQGKTGFVEAIYLLLRGQSFRSGGSEALIRQTPSGICPSCSVTGRLFRDGLTHDISWKNANGLKKHEWNGKRVSGTVLGRDFPLVLFSPESLAAIKDGPEQRRLLVDEVLLAHSAAAGEVIKDYRKVLKTRNRVLADRKRGLGVTEASRLLDSLNAIFFPLAAELTFLRLQALVDLAPELAKACAELLETRELVEIDYLVSGESARGWQREKLLDAMHKKSEERRSAELESGLTLVGPHRHDIRILFAGKDSRYFCSQGQQRALILSYKMAQIMYHHRTHQVFPFLLLDDVLSELDPERRVNLVRFLKEVPSQIFLTTTDFSFSPDFGDRSLSVFRVEKGVIESAGNPKGVRRHIDSSPRGP